MSLDEFNSWQETFYLLANPANAEHLRESQKSKMKPLGKKRKNVLLQKVSVKEGVKEDVKE